MLRDVVHQVNNISCRLKCFEIVVNSYRRLEEVRLCLQRRGILRTVDCRGLEDEGSKLLPNAG